MKKEARYYEKLEKNMVRCNLCPHKCILRDGMYGICGVRKNEGGSLYTKIYGEVSSIAIDPIEKKPLYHLYPGSYILSIGTVGCNLKCHFCQNYHISQNPNYPTDYITPEKLLEISQIKHSIGIAYTYSEPMIWFEFVLDTAKLFSEKGYINVLVTNAEMELSPFSELLQYIQAMNIDLKYFNEKSYRIHSKGDMKTVLENIEYAYKSGKLVEVTHLVVTGINDDVGEFKELVSWLAGVSPEIPLHISRYFPSYKYNAPPTDIHTLYNFYQIATEKLNYVYLGNLVVKKEANTYCPKCGALLIKRDNYTIEKINIENGICKICKEKIYGIF
jgi:pyruvate formate lyase activating enzyme